MNTLWLRVQQFDGNKHQLDWNLIWHLIKKLFLFIEAELMIGLCCGVMAMVHTVIILYIILDYSLSLNDKLNWMILDRN